MLLNKKVLFIIFFLLVDLIFQFDCITEAKNFQFTHYSFRRKQRNNAKFFTNSNEDNSDDTHARKYNSREEECAKEKCGDIEGLIKTKCTRKCISQQCYTELYAWNELEEGEIDVRHNSFKGCYMKELQEMERQGLI